MSVKHTGYPSKDRAHLQGVSFSKLHPLILPLSMFLTFLLINGKDLDKPALVRDSDGKVWTRRQLKEDTLAIATSLSDMNFRRGHTMAISTTNLYEGIVLALAANAIGMRVKYCNPLSTNTQLLDELRLYEADVLAVSDKTGSYIDMLLLNLPHLKKVINVSSTEAIIDVATRVHSGRVTTYLAMLSDGKQSTVNIWPTIWRNAFSKKDRLFLQTSGSTSGRPKGLPFSNENIFAALMYAKNSTGTNTQDARVEKVLCILPYRFPYGWMTIFVNLIGGNLVELATSATPEAIGRYYLSRPSYIYGTPRFLRDFMDYTPADADLSFLQAFFCSGFSLPEEDYEEGIAFLRAHNSQAEIRTNYGIGEGLCIGTASDGIPHRPGTNGKFYVGPTWVIVDENMHEVKYGEVGEALVYSKSLCNGYYADPEKTRESFVRFRGKRFFRTGDLLSLSRDGYVSFVDRKKRFYQPVGATDKVNCETIEKALLSLTDIVRDCAVVIHSHDHIDESQAFVVLTPGRMATPATRAEITLRLRRELLDFQMPAKINFLSGLPIMDSGKVDHKMLESFCRP